MTNVNIENLYIEDISSDKKDNFSFLDIDFNNVNIDELVSDRKKFDAFIYTPAVEAVQELEKRFVNDSILEHPSIPAILKRKKKLIIARHITTPNFEFLRFMSAVDALEIEPLFIEYSKDKMSFENRSKYFLCKLTFFKGFGKSNGLKTDVFKIGNFQNVNGVKISEICIKNDLDLVNFHHKLFFEKYGNHKENIFDISDWYKEQGKVPSEYYHSLFNFFVKNGILFENFLLNKQEINFTKEVILKNFISVWKETGYKPLIVALEPTTIEGDDFSYFYSQDVQDVVSDLI